MTKKEESNTAKDKKDETPADEIAKETMTGDIRDAILQIVRDQKKPWAQLSENEQSIVIENVAQRSVAIVAKAVKIINSGGRKTVMGTLESLAIKDGIKAVIKVGKHDELRHELSDSVGLAVLMVVSDAEEYKGEKKPATVKRDQKHMFEKDDKPVADNGRATAAVA